MIANRRLVRPIASGTVSSHPSPSLNKLLAALPPSDYLRILPSLRKIPIKFKQVLQKQGETDLAKIAETRIRKQTQILHEEDALRFVIPKEYGIWVVFGCTTLFLATLALSFRMVWNAIAQARLETVPD